MSVSDQYFIWKSWKRNKTCLISYFYSKTYLINVIEDLCKSNTVLYIQKRSCGLPTVEHPTQSCSCEKQDSSSCCFLLPYGDLSSCLGLESFLAFTVCPLLYCCLPQCISLFFSLFLCFLLSYGSLSVFLGLKFFWRLSSISAAQWPLNNESHDSVCMPIISLCQKRSHKKYRMPFNKNGTQKSWQRRRELKQKDENEQNYCQNMKEHQRTKDRGRNIQNAIK